MNTTTSKQKPVVAAFDFDGTITKRDTLISFLFYVAGYRAGVRKLFTLIPSFIRYLFFTLSRQEMKEIALTTFFAGMSIDQLSGLGEDFANSSILKNLVLPAALQRIKWHQSQRHRCVLISASINVYLEPWAKKIGFNDLICSRIDVTSSAIVTGKLTGINCWGPEKLRCLEEKFGSHENYVLFAYGDSRGDKEMLAAADHSFYRQMSHFKQ